MRADQRPPNSRCTSQPSSPESASGRALGLARAGGGARFGAIGVYGASEADAGGAERSVICETVACGPGPSEFCPNEPCATLAKKPGSRDVGSMATGTP